MKNVLITNVLQPYLNSFAVLIETGEGVYIPSKVAKTIKGGPKEGTTIQVLLTSNERPESGNPWKATAVQDSAEPFNWLAPDAQPELALEPVPTPAPEPEPELTPTEQIVESVNGYFDTAPESYVTAGDIGW